MSKEPWIKDVFAVDCEYGVYGKCQAYRGIDEEGYRNCLLIGQVDDMYFCPKLHYSREECLAWYKREKEKEKTEYKSAAEITINKEILEAITTIEDILKEIKEKKNENN